jgi:Zn finger protein HypA/HybF involved in hydrogenase expression
MGFVPIKIPDYVRLHLRNNRGETADAVTKRLQSALDAYQAGSRCQCGAPIWVIGSAEAGNACFTCITGESDPSEDYEIAEACDKDDMRLSGTIQLLVKNRSRG